MFVALKDIVHAKGRFTLMIGVIALLTLLLVLLTGLTRGLAHQNISAIEALPADRIVLTPTLGDDISWSDSQVDTDQAAIWDDTSGIETEPVSVGQMRIETDSAVTSLACSASIPTVRSRPACPPSRPRTRCCCPATSPPTSRSPPVTPSRSTAVTSRSSGPCPPTGTPTPPSGTCPSSPSAPWP